MNKSAKTIIVAIVIVVLGAAVFCLYKNRTVDNAAALVDKLQKESGVTFENKGEKEFRWITYDGEKTVDTTVSGTLYAAEKVEFKNYKKIEEYLNKTYGMDMYNLADGVTGGLRGYYVNDMACDLGFSYIDTKIGTEGALELVTNDVDITLECGYVD